MWPFRHVTDTEIVLIGWCRAAWTDRHGDISVSEVTEVEGDLEPSPQWWVISGEGEGKKEKSAFCDAFGKLKHHRNPYMPWLWKCVSTFL